MERTNNSQHIFEKEQSKKNNKEKEKGRISIRYQDLL